MAFIGRAVAPAPISANDVPDLPASKITSGTFAESFLTNATTDLQPIKSDITALALREATNESSASFNLPNQHIDTFATDTLGTKTDVSVGSGFVSSIGGIAIPTNSKFLLQSETSNGSTTFTDTSGTSVGIPNVYNYTHSTAQAKFGSSSVRAVNNGNIGGTHSSVSSHFNIGTNNFSIEAWIRIDSGSLNSERYILSKGGYGVVDTDHDGWGWRIQTNNEFAWYANHGGTVVDIHSNPYSWVADTWYHIRVSKSSNTYYYHVNGTSIGTNSVSNASTSINVGSRDYKVGASSDNGGKWNGYIEELLFVNGSALSTSTASFTPNTEPYGLVANATGTAIQNTNTVGSAKTKVGGTMLYKDSNGTATLGTDLKVYFTCNGGTNWTEASSYSAITPVYSTGVKQVRLGETTCTSGTDVRYKVEWANQSQGSKETQLHGIGINY